MGNEIKDMVEVVEGIVNAVPVYEDLAQPTTQRVGRALDGTVRIFLAPVSGLVWGYDKIASWLPDAISEVFKKREVSEERITTPVASVAGPAIEAMRFVGSELDLREMYANLLATAMDSKSAHFAHPAFVEIIKQLNPDEARILKCLKPSDWHPMVDLCEVYKETGAFDYVYRNVTLLGDLARVSHPALCSSYIDNLARLGLIELLDAWVAGESPYTLLEMDASLVAMRIEIEKQTNKKARLNKRSIVLTEFGKQFCQACVLESEQ